MPDIRIASKEAQEILASIVKQHFSDSDAEEHFVGKPVVALFRHTDPDDLWEKKGVTVRGQFAKLNAVAKAVSDPSLWESPVDAGLPAEVPPHAVVILNREVYNALNRNGKRALIHHELLFAFRALDIQEFSDIVDAYGLWDDSLKDFGLKAADQLELALGEFGDEGAEDLDVTITAGGKTTKTTTAELDATAARMARADGAGARAPN